PPRPSAPAIWLPPRSPPKAPPGGGRNPPAPLHAGRLADQVERAVVQQSRGETAAGDGLLLERTLACGQVVTGYGRDPADRAGEEKKQRPPAVGPKLLDRIVLDSMRAKLSEVAL